MGHEGSSACEGFKRLGHVGSWLTHVLSLPDNEGRAAVALASPASAGRAGKSKTPSEMVLAFRFWFCLLASWGGFAWLRIPGVSAVKPGVPPLPFEEAALKVQPRLSAEALGNAGRKALGSAMFEADMKCCSHDLSWKKNLPSPLLRAGQ